MKGSQRWKQKTKKLLIPKNKKNLRQPRKKKNIEHSM